MNKVITAFRTAREEGRTALMPYVTAGDPPAPGLERLLVSLDQAGADIIEIGIPFSDPIADGPVIASAMYRALERGVTPQEVFEQVRSARTEVEAGLVAMVSISIVVHLGVADFINQAAAAGFDGVIVPDADLDDLGVLAEACSAVNLALIPLIAPTTSLARQEALARNASGFVYMLARAGVTGERAAAPEIGDRIEALRSVTDLPIGVGFGISSSEHVRSVGVHADGAIVGSALVRVLDDAHRSGNDVAAAAVDFVEGLKG